MKLFYFLDYSLSIKNYYMKSSHTNTLTKPAEIKTSIEIKK